MGGNHKKNLRTEKAKVKLKGAKLPKGLNVTKTDFKVRKITIRDQLKESQFVDGRRQVNLKETLSRLKHHSSNFRLEALRNLKEAIAASHSGIISQLSEIIQGISAICLDVEKEPRRESFKTLSALLGALQTEAVAPFFHVISSYLRCAMTHIQPTLQEDSLLMLDVLLQHVPRLVAAHSAKIFQNFLEMISRVRAEGDRAGRTLTVNMGQKQTTIKWRFTVLQRLQQMLQTLAEHNRRNVLEASGGSDGGGKKYTTYTFNVKELQYFSLIRSYATSTQNVCDLSAIFNRSVGASAANATLNTDNNTVDEADFILRNYVEHLMPLLLEAWLEVRPQEAAAGAHVVLSHDAAITLKVVLEIIENLWCLVELHEKQVNNHDLSNWFQEEYADLFAINFLLTSFPYQQNDTTTATNSGKKSKKLNTPDAGGQYCQPQNLSLTHLMCRFFAQHRMDQQRSKFSTLLQYLNTVVNNLKIHSSESYRHLETALRAHLLKRGIELLQINNTEMCLLLRSTIKAFLKNQFSHKDATTNIVGISAKVLILLCDIVQTPNLCEAYGVQEFVDFLEYLPQLLLKPTITEAALISMSNLGKQKNEVFLKALEKMIIPVIENIQKMQVVGACNAFEGKRHIMNLFYWTDKQWSSEQLKDLIKRIEENISDKRIVGYYKFILE